MTNQEAIKWIERFELAFPLPIEDYIDAKEALDMAIKALEQTELNPSYNGVKTELDCISREEVIKLLEKEDWADTVEGVLALPPVQPQRKRGKWLWELAPNGWANHICSECGFKENTDIHVKLNWRYCPKCGVEMRGDTDETN